MLHYVVIVYVKYLFFKTDVLGEDVDYRHNVAELHIHRKEVYFDTDYNFLKVKWQIYSATS